MITESRYAERAVHEANHIKKLLKEGKQAEAIALSLDLSKREIKAVDHYLNELVALIPPINGIEMRYFVVALKILQNITWELNGDEAAEVLYTVASSCLNDNIGMTAIRTGEAKADETK